MSQSTVALTDAEKVSVWLAHWGIVNPALVRDLVDVVAAARADERERPAGRTVTEWGVRWHDVTGTSIPVGSVRMHDPGDRRYNSERDAWLDCPPGAHVVSRQRTTHPEVVTDWTPAASAQPADTEAGR